MNRMTVGLSAGLIALSAALSGCATSTAGDTYSRDQVGSVNQVEMGTVLGVRQVKIEGTKSGIGTTAGVIAGGAAGSQIGGGTASNIIGGVAGAVVGGLIGAAAEEGLTRDTGYEYSIKLDDGRTVTIVQAGDAAIAPGTRVQVIFGERARVVPAP
jgi:outer membrane lipoprotein SlyB